MIYLVMGVSGAGKTTVGRALAVALGCDFLEGDSLHPAANIEKMAHGIPLDDADRAPWLAAIRRHLEAAARAGRMLVVACSALKQRYRDQLDHGLAVRWVYLRGDPAMLHQRLAHRQGHYMKANMLASQLADLEEPSPQSALIVDAALPLPAIVAQVLAHH
ncbi:MAG TPA: gluconokinase [Terriglobales bacterium]|nr:gluconokinase [Terriglobales bacterium]